MLVLTWLKLLWHIWERNMALTLPMVLLQPWMLNRYFFIRCISESEILTTLVFSDDLKWNKYSRHLPDLLLQSKWKILEMPPFLVPLLINKKSLQLSKIMTPKKEPILHLTLLILEVSFFSVFQILHIRFYLKMRTMVQQWYLQIYSVGKDKLQEILNWLSDEGHIYSTIDDDHFKTT